jgi:hypothetical protein
MELGEAPPAPLPAETETPIPGSPRSSTTGFETAQESFEGPAHPSHPVDDADDKSNEPLEGEVRRSSRARTESAYVRRLASGEGAVSQYSRDGSFPRGLRLPTKNEEVEADLMGAAMEEVHELAAAMAEAEGIEPVTLKEARGLPEWSEWLKAIEEEFENHWKAGTWEVVDLPPNIKPIESKFVFKNKVDSDGTVIRRKVRMVAKGFTQVPNVDYFDTFAPVARLSSLRTVLAMAAKDDLELHQVDVKAAFLNGVLEERKNVYMRMPRGWDGLPDGKILKLRKAIYGLKQAGRRWYQRLSSILHRLGFVKCDVDQAVFFKCHGDTLTVLVIHVDDCTIAASSLKLVDDFKQGIRQHVEITDLGPIHWVLGIRVDRDRNMKTVTISQRNYIDSILRRFHFEDCKPVSTPMEPSARLSASQLATTSRERAEMKLIPYREAIGSLMYAFIATRPDISFAVAILSRFCGAPGSPHWEAVKRVFRYLKGTRDLGLTFSLDGEGGMIGYGDADGSMQDDRRAISGHAFLINGGAVSWYSKRQEIVSLSTTESEYISATHAAKEALWLRSLIRQVFRPLPDATTVFSDNQSAIALAHDHQFHARTKHIDVRFHFVRWVIEQGQIRLVYCPTQDMVADILTKALPSLKVKHFASRLGLRVL